MGIGARVKEARQSAKLTQKALAERAGISQQALSALERGENESTVKLVEIATVTGVTPGWLATGEADASSQPARLDVDKLAGLIETVDAAVEQSGRVVPARTRARLVAALYADRSGGATQAAEAVTQALASILTTLEDA